MTKRNLAGKIFGIALVLVMVGVMFGEPAAGLRSTGFAFQSQALAQEAKIWYVDYDRTDYPDADFTKIRDAVNTTSETSSTYVGGNISSNTRWIAADSPYIVIENIVVKNGATLTIEPTVVIKFNADKMLQVEGELIAMGTDVEPIVFTSNHPSPSPGDWAGIEFTDSSVDASYQGGNYLSGSIMQYCTIEYGGSGIAALKIESASPFIDNCVIKDNNAPGIHISGGSVEVTNSTITRNSISASGDAYGGGIYASGEGITIRGNTISENSISAVSGWFSEYSAYGGGVYISGTATINDNIIANNSAIGIGSVCMADAYGGGIYASGTVTISNNTIDNNRASPGPSGAYADTYGGGIYTSGTATINNNAITNNSAPGSDRYGGGIYASGVATISNNTVINNSVSGGTAAGWTYAYGGGIYASGAQIIVSDNSISYNTALNSYGLGSGGGIYATGNGIDIANNSITNNEISTEDAYHAERFGATGAGIYASGTMAVHDNDISDNSALETSYDSGGAYGGGIYASSSVVIRGNKITNNFALDEGGGVYGGSTINQNSVIDNSANTGGGIYSSATMSSNTIIGNTANKGKGGGVHALGQPSLNYNDIYSNSPYDIYNSNSKGSPDIDATNNWWGTTDEAEIQAHIYDWFDDSSLGLVNFIPYLTSPVVRTWYVDDDLADKPDADFTRIQDGVNAASPGDTIIVYPGTYTENVDVNKEHLTIKSENGANSTIVEAADSGDHVFDVTADYVNISGFTVKQASHAVGIFVNQSQFGSISNNVVMANESGILLHGFYRYASNNTLANNTVESNNRSGILLDLAPNTNMTGNLIYENGWNFGVGAASSQLFIQNIDTTNTVNGKPILYLVNESDLVIDSSSDVGYLGIISCTNITVRELSLGHNYQGVLLVDSTDSVIENVSVSNAFDGIHLAFSSGNSLNDNVAESNSYGIYLYQSHDNSLTSNVAGSNTVGIGLGAFSDANTLADNTVDANCAGLYLDGPSDNSIIRNMLSHNYGYAILISGGSANVIYLNNFINNAQNVRPAGAAGQVWNSPEQITYTYNDSTHRNYLGNYWDNYTERYPGASEIDSTGIWDTPYSIDSDADNYPLLEPFENYEIGPASYPVITSPLEITPKDTYYVGDTLTANFTITNRGTESVTLDVLTVGGRLNGWCLAEGCPDFTHRAITLQPAESYQYEGALTLTHAGNYHFFIAYYIENPTPEEKKLLDENNWNTCVYLGEGLTHADRVKNVIVLEEPDTVSELRDRINHKLQCQVKYPPYLPDPNSFTNAVATLWAEFTSWITQTHLTEKYDELYQAGIDYDSLSFKALIDARNSLDRDDIVSAEKYLQRSYTYDRLSAMSFGAAAEVFDNNLEAGEILAEGIKDGCEASVKFGLGVTNPPAAKAADYIYIGVDYAVDRVLVGEEEATKNAIINAAVTTVFNQVRFKDLGDRTIADYTNNRIGKVTFPMLQEAFQNNEQVQFLLSKAIKECGVEIEEEVAEDIVTCILNELEKAINLEQAKVESPVELQVYDSQGETTGLLNGQVEHGISRSVYCGGTVTTFFPSDAYRYEVVGIDEGLYGLEVNSIEDGNATAVAAVDVPISTNATHNYTINWTALSQGEKAVTIEIDSDGDGVVDETVFTAPPDEPSNPSPPDGAGNILVDIVLNWAGGDPDGDNVTYKVYFGTDENPPLVSGNQNETSYSPSLNYGTKYYWRVVARDEHGIATEGPVWQFTTVGATLEGHVSFPGRGTAPDDRWIESFNVTLFEAGNLSNVLWTGSAITNNSGVFTIPGLTPGTYDIGIKNWTCLSEVNSSVTLTADNTTVVNFGTTREGDSNNDDIITGADRSLLYSGWGKSQGEAGYDIHYDFNRDGSLTGADRSLMYAYWAQHGDLVS